MKQVWRYWSGSQYDFVNYCKDNYGLDLSNELESYENHISDINAERKRIWDANHERNC